MKTKASKNKRNIDRIVMIPKINAFIYFRQLRA